MRIREEGYRRPQDALLSVQGVRVGRARSRASHSLWRRATRPPRQLLALLPPRPKPSLSACSARTREPNATRCEKLYKALTEAKKKSGEKVSGNLDSFAAFVQKKTDQIRKQYSLRGS